MATITELEDYIVSIQESIDALGTPQNDAEVSFKALLRRDLELAEARLDELMRGEQ